MRVHISEIGAVLDTAERDFKNAFWKELEGLTLVHATHGGGMVSNVDGTLVRVAHGNDLKTYSTSVLHSFLTELSEIPENSVAASAILFNREVGQLTTKWAAWQIDWRGLWEYADIIKELLDGWEATQAFSQADINRARSIGIGHIIPLSHEMIAPSKPWNYVKASAQWRKLGLPREGIRCIREGLSPALKQSGGASNLIRAGLTSLIAAMVDDDQLAAAEEYVGKLAQRCPNEQSCLALFRYYRAISDEAQMGLWLEKAREFGVEPSAEPKPPRRPAWVAKWRRNSSDEKLSPVHFF